MAWNQVRVCELMQIKTKFPARERRDGPDQGLSAEEMTGWTLGLVRLAPPPGAAPLRRFAVPSAGRTSAAEDDPGPQMLRMSL